MIHERHYANFLTGEVEQSHKPLDLSFLGSGPTNLGDIFLDLIARSTPLVVLECMTLN